MQTEVAIVGAGITGLACARRLQMAGVPFTIFEAADRVGGRVATDFIDGYLLDRGFQLFFESYEEMLLWIDLADLDLGHFYSAATVYDGANVIDFANPVEEGLTALPATFQGWASFSDKAKLAALYITDALKAVPFPQKGETTLAFLLKKGYSEQTMHRLFRPFFGDVFLDRGLSPDAGFFLYLLKKFASNKGSLPAQGMGAIPKLMAEPIDPQKIRLNHKINALDELDQTFTHIVNTRPPAKDGTTIWHGTVNLYFAGDRLLNSKGKLQLNAQDGLIRNACVVSEAQPAYAPEGHSLISVTINPKASARTTDELIMTVRPTLNHWYGDISDFRFMGRYDIPYALPLSKAPDNLPYSKSGKRYQCGDAHAYPSMNGAALSGRLVAEDILRAAF